LTGALVRRLGGHEVGGGEEPVFQVVDAEFSRLAVGHRTEVAGHLQASPVGGLDRRAEHLAGDVQVRLEGGRPGIGPEVRHPARVLGVAQAIELA